MTWIANSKSLLTCCCAAFFFDLGSLRRVFGFGIMSVYYSVDELPITRLYGVVVVACKSLRRGDDSAKTEV